MNIWFIGAALLSFSVCLTHIFLGGKEAARPLLDADMGAIPKYTNYYCWHMVTIVIGGLGVMFTLAAVRVDAIMLAGCATSFAALFSLWNMALYLVRRRNFRHWYELPQWLLFAPIAVLGSIGLACA